MSSSHLIFGSRSQSKEYSPELLFEGFREMIPADWDLSLEFSLLLALQFGNVEYLHYAYNQDNEKQMENKLQR